MNNDPRGTMMQQGNLIFINNALIEEVSCSNDFFSEILISYAVRENNTISIQMIRLNLNHRTLILDESGQSTCLCCLRRGMWINVIFSSQMTRSNPPQANAFLVAIQRSPQPSMPPRPTPPPPPRPMPPQRPEPRPRPNQPQRPGQPQMPNWPQNSDQFQMPNQPQGFEQFQMPDRSQNPNQSQMPNWSQNSSQRQNPSQMQNEAERLSNSIFR